MPDPLFSITIVTRNRREELNRALTSVFTQPYRPIEVVVVDNDSGDGSGDMVRKKWPEVRLIELHRNIGCQPGRNIAMKNCRGEYIFNLDDDGWLDERTLRLMKSEFDRDPLLWVIGARIEVPSGLSRGWSTPLEGEERSYAANFPGGAAGLRKDALEAAGFFPEYVRGHSEADLSLRILDRGKRILYLPEAVVYHEPSEIERQRGDVRYWGIRHRLETTLRLEPFPYVLFDIPWKILADLRGSMKNRTFIAFLRGVGRFIYEIPLLMSARSPVSRRTMAWRDYLSSHRLHSPDDFPTALRRYSLLARLRDKFAGGS